MRRRWSWGTERPAPECPSRRVYFMDAEEVAGLDEDEQRVQADDPEGCLIVGDWERARGETADARREQYCRQCPLNNGEWPRSTRLYRTATRHLAEAELGIARDREGYTAREREAILVVANERNRLRLKHSREMPAGHLAGLTGVSGGPETPAG